MSDEQGKQGFTAYEYANITVKRDAEALYGDCYRSFGWEVAEGNRPLLADPGRVTLKLKRDRRLKNRTEVNALQRKCENALLNIERLEEKKTSTAQITALVIGLLGTAFMALAVFSYLWGLLPLMVLFAIPGFLGWGLSYFAYKSIRRKGTIKAEPLIDAQYDVIYTTCEAADAMLA